MTGVEERLVLVLLCVSYLAKCLLLAEESTVTEERKEGLALCAVYAQKQGFVPAPINIVQTYVHTLSQMHHATHNEAHIHQGIYMTQVPLLGVVGGHVIHRCTQRETSCRSYSHPALQVQFLQGLVPGILVGKLQQVERCLHGIDEVRCGKSLCRSVAIPHLAVHHHKFGQTCNGRRLHTEGKFILGGEIVLQTSISALTKQHYLRFSTMPKRMKTGGVLAIEPVFSEAHISQCAPIEGAVCWCSPCSTWHDGHKEMKKKTR